jgi:hypothetical protein
MNARCTRAVSGQRTEGARWARCNTPSFAVPDAAPPSETAQELENSIEYFPNPAGINTARPELYARPHCVQIQTGPAAHRAVAGVRFRPVRFIRP